MTLGGLWDPGEQRQGPQRSHAHGRGSSGLIVIGPPSNWTKAMTRTGALGCPESGVLRQLGSRLLSRSR